MLHLILPYATATVCLICGAMFIYLINQYRYWKRRGIPGPVPSMVVGNMMESLSLRCTEPTMIDSWYQQYRNEPYIGFYNLWKPTLLIIDLDLVKKVTEVDFSHFTDHPPFRGNSDNDLVTLSLFQMKGEIWKMKRQIFSRLFTPRRLKQHCDILNYNNSILINEIENHLKSNKDIELCDVVGRHILRTLMSTLYGLDLTNDEERMSELEKLSEKFLCPNIDSVLMFLFYTVAPDLFAGLKLKTFPAVFWNYFSPFTANLLSTRSQLNIQREDIISIIGQWQDEGKSETERMEHWEAVAHVFSFFNASLHTSLIIISYALYMLAQHPRVQEKLQQEIDQVLNGEENITYESLKKMPYLDAVLNETQRFYPLAGTLKRVCNKTYKVDDKLTIPKGMDILIPVQSMHMDPQYFPEPQKFEPERFIGLEKLPTAFMPFGKGPRICIGIRLATVYFKIAVAKIVSIYNVLPSPKSNHPIKYDVKSLFITCRPQDGIWVNLERRQKHTMTSFTSETS